MTDSTGTSSAGAGAPRGAATAAGLDAAAAPDAAAGLGAAAAPDAAAPGHAVPRATQVRQGDVLLVPVDAELAAELAADARPLPRATGRVILAEGEVTGHAHAIRAAGATLLAAGPDRFLRVTAPVSLDHEEHAPISVGPGTYRVVIQREYVPPEISPVAFRRVVD